MVLLDGKNFGSDISNIKVFFNLKEARVLGSTGTRILVRVPRLPGDTCVLSVEVGGQKANAPGFFRYKRSASVITIAGNGNSDLKTDDGLANSQLRPVYLTVDKDYNIITTSESAKNVLLKLNVAENSIVVLADGDHGISPRFQPSAHPETGVLMFGGEGAENANRFIVLDPVEGWAPKSRFIKSWKLNGYSEPSNPDHHQCLYCTADGYYYTRYSSGELVKLDVQYMEAEIIWKTPPGIIYGMAFHPQRPTELWVCYENGHGGDLSNSICTLDVTDTTSFKRLGGVPSGGHRDGPIAQAQFYAVRQMSFDPDGNLFVGDHGNHCIRRIDTENMIVETVIGIPGVEGFKDGTKDDAQFRGLHGLATDPDGVIYVNDYNNNRVRRIAIE
jgi:hypothetical protein